MLNIADIISWVKPTPKYLIPMTILTSTLILLPDAVTVKFGLDTFIDNNRLWIGFIFLASCAFLLTFLGYYIKEIFMEWNRKRRMIKESIKSLSHLSPEEKEELSNYIIFETKSWRLKPEDGIATSLEKANLIYLACNRGHIIDGFAYNLYPCVWDELNKYPELLEPELSERMKQLKKSR